MRIRLTFAVLLLAASSAQAWSGEPEKPHHADLAEHALGLLHANQTAGIRMHLDAYRKGALDADVELAPQYHRYDPATGNGSAILYIDRAASAIRSNLTDRDPTPEDARQLGILVHVLTDLTQPLHTGSGSINAPYHAEYEVAAYEHALRVPPSAEQLPTSSNVTNLALQISRASAAHANELEALLAEDGPWNADIARLTIATLQEGMALVGASLAAILPTPSPPPPVPSPTSTPPASPSAGPTLPPASVEESARGPDDVVVVIPGSVPAILAGCAVGLIVWHHSRPFRNR